MTSQSDAKQDPVPRQHHSVVIYIVDDEPMLVDLAELILKPDGHVIRKFYGPEPALKTFLADRNSPTLLITDYAMGAMSGIDLAVLCKRKHPDLKIIIMSGTAGPEILAGAPITIDRFLAKPYDASTLLQMVRSLLADQR